MGTYLSTPVTEKGKEEGESLHCPITPVAWGVVDMQGWRKSMEDAHVARTDVHIPKHLLQQMMQKQQQQDEGGGETAVLSSPLPQNVDAKVFGVFDGHGGPEVSRFCQLYLVSVLQHQPTWSEKRGEGAASGSSAWPLPISATDRITMNEMSTDYRHDSDIGRALRMCFHALDRLIDHPSRREELVRLRAIKPQPGEQREIDDADHIPPPAEFVGGPLIHISCKDDDENENETTTAPATVAAGVDAAVVDEEREEEENAATLSSDTSITTAVADSSPSSSSPVKDNDGDIDASSGSDDIAGDDVAATDSESTATSTENKTIGSDSISTSCDETGKPQEQGIHKVTTPSSPTTTTTTITSETKEGDNESTEKSDGDIVTETKKDEAKEEVHDRPDSDDKNSIDSDKDVEDAVASSSSGSDDDEDSEQAAGVEEAAELDRDLMNDEDDDDENDVNDKDENDGDDDEDDDGAIEHTPLPALPAVSAVESSPPSISTTTAGKVSTMFQRLLSLSGTSPAVATGQFAAVLSGSIGGGSSGDNAAAVAGSTGILPPPPPPPRPPPLPPVGSPGGGPCASLPTIVQNGRMICNLPEHPIHAGATAIVAVICGKTLTVANAGDSRAVLCRGGGGGGTNGADHQTLALSFDHKPQQEVEMNRIHRAGGFVNHFGRVNGNLNLSRSIGDLKYKQVPGIRPADQMISAEPDIVEVQLNDDDEFLILGCDGIWDCLSNEQAVDYVRRRIHSKTPTEIGVEMLDEILSTDPRVTQGIGGDNMTIMIIDLQPHSRSYRTSSNSSRHRRGDSGRRNQNSDCDDTSPVL